MHHCCHPGIRGSEYPGSSRASPLGPGYLLCKFRDDNHLASLLASRNGSSAASASFGILLGDEMAGEDGGAADVGAPGAPDVERGGGLGVEIVAGPQHEGRAGDLAARSQVGLVEGAIEREAGAIVLADGMYAVRRLQQRAVVLHGLGRERGEVARLGPALERVLQVVDGLPVDQRLGHRMRLGEERPVIGFEGAIGIHASPLLGRRHDVDRHKCAHGLGVVERQAVGDPSTAVVAGHHEPLVAERAHHGEAVLGHRALGVDRVLGVAARRGAGAVAAQVGDDQGELARQLGRHLVPADVGLRVAVQQEQRRARAAGAQEDRAAGGVDAPCLETGKEIGQRTHAFRSVGRSRANARQPMSLRQKPPGQSILATAS